MALDDLFNDLGMKRTGHMLTCLLCEKDVAGPIETMAMMNKTIIVGLTPELFQIFLVAYAGHIITHHTKGWKDEDLARAISLRLNQERGN